MMLLSIQDWLGLTGSLAAALSPAYLILMKAEKEISKMQEAIVTMKESVKIMETSITELKDVASEVRAIVTSCPYCMRRSV